MSAWSSLFLLETFNRASPVSSASNNDQGRWLGQNQLQAGVGIVGGFNPVTLVSENGSQVGQNIGLVIDYDYFGFVRNDITPRFFLRS